MKKPTQKVKTKKSNSAWAIVWKGTGEIITMTMGMAILDHKGWTDAYIKYFGIDKKDIEVIPVEIHYSL